MSTPTDFTQLPNKILVDLINETNSTALTVNDITFGAVTALSSGNKNTGVTITAVAGSGYVDSKDLTYDRVDFATIPGSRSVKFMKGTANNLSDIVGALNAAYQLNLQPEDFVDVPMPTFTGTTPHEIEHVTLTAAAGSYIFRGSLVLEIDGNDVSLTTLITTTELAGLTYPTF